MPPTVSAPTSRKAIRGAIRVQVSTSRDAIIAGDLFSVFVKVQNPFEVPLGVLEVSAFVPVEFYDVEQRRQDAAGARAKLTGGVTRAAQAVGGLVGLNLKGELNRESSSLGRVSARGISAPRPAVAGGDPNSPPSDEAVLQPGNSTTQVFTLCTRHERRFRPGSYRMQISVRYRFDPDQGPSEDGDDNVDVIEYVLDVRASLSSILMGGVIGSVAGWYAKNLQGLAKLSFGQAAALLLVHVLLTLGVLLLFARKKDVQPLLSVEDTYGAALIGFMIGFTGGDAVSSMLQFPGGSGVKG